MHHLGDGVGTEDLVDAVGLDGDYALALGYEHGGDVGEVELAVRVVGGEGIELAEERFGFEAVDAGVDFGCVELVWAEGLLFDDGYDFGAFRFEAQDAAIAGGIGWDGGEDGHRGLFLEMDVADGGDGLGADEGDVARENQEMSGEGRA